jgi:hypothetical protein
MRQPLPPGAILPYALLFVNVVRGNQYPDRSSLPDPCCDIQSTSGIPVMSLYGTCSILTRRKVRSSLRVAQTLQPASHASQCTCPRLHRAGMRHAGLWQQKLLCMSRDLNCIFTVRTYVLSFGARLLIACAPCRAMESLLLPKGPPDGALAFSVWAHH